MKKLSAILLIMLTVARLEGQYYVGSELLIPQSAAISGMGEVSVALPLNDPLSIQFNPANGLAAYNGIEATLANSDNNYLGRWDFFHFGINVIPAKYPVKLVLNFQYNDSKSIYSKLFVGDPFFYRNNIFAYSASFGYAQRKYLPVNIALGITRKYIDNYFRNGELIYIDADDVIYDFGGRVDFPFIFDNETILRSCHLKIDPGFGLSLLNYGGLCTNKHLEIPTDDDEIIRPKNPFPRYLRLGISLSAELQNKGGEELVKLSLSREAGDLLADLTANYRTPFLPYVRGNYQNNIFSNIDFFDIFIENKSRHKVDIRNGMEVSLFESVSLRYGSIKNYEKTKTHGIGIHSVGIMKILDNYIRPINLSKMNELIEIHYNYAKYSKFLYYMPNDGDKEQVIRSLSIHFKNIESLF